MSIKIYYAVRFPLANFTEGLDYLHDRMLDNIKLVYHKLLKSIEIDKVSTDREKKFYLIRLASTEPKIFQELLPDGGWNIWIHKNYVYAIPFGAYIYYENICDASSNWPEWLEDFHYQNQSDPPEDIPEEEYEAREEIWEEICLGHNREKNGQFARKLVHFVFDSNSHYWSVEC